MTRVSVVIVNANGADLLDDCLCSLQKQTMKDFEVLFVDNGSTDDSLDRARRLMPNIRCIPLETNTGFAVGNNKGMAEANGRYIVLLNNDTKVDPRFLEELVQVAESQRRVGLVAPKILNFYEPQRIDSVGGLVICPDGIAQGRGRGEIDSGQYDDLREILLPSGCAALYSREMLDEIGMFDDSFFMYCEDTDLGLRARWAGWKALSAPRAIVYHKYSGFSSAYSPFKMFLVERNHYLTAIKNFPPTFLLALPAWSLYRFWLMALAVFSKKGKGQAGQLDNLLAAFLRGHLSAILKGVGILFSKSANKRISNREFARLLKTHRLSLRRMIFSE